MISQVRNPSRFLGPDLASPIQLLAHGYCQIWDTLQLQVLYIQIHRWPPNPKRTCPMPMKPRCRFCVRNIRRNRQYGYTGPGLLVAFARQGRYSKSSQYWLAWWPMLCQLLSTFMNISGGTLAIQNANGFREVVVACTPNNSTVRPCIC